MKIESFQDLLVSELKDLYSAENQLVKALPSMVKTATSPELKQAFQQHLKETERQVERLEKVGEQLGASLRGKKCKGMEALIEEGKELKQDAEEPEVLDAGLAGAARKVEHYEIVAYESVAELAEVLGMPRAAQLLQQSLEEERAADLKLASIGGNLVGSQSEQMERVELDLESSRM